MGDRRKCTIFNLTYLCLCVFSVSVGQHQAKAGKTMEAGGLTTNFRYYFLDGQYHKDCHEVTSGCSATYNISGVNVIKPDGYPEPFEVYCDNSQDSGGWTVIQRRVDGALEFNRTWEEYKNGFGFLSNEFWFGNEKLAYLLNQKKYQLRIDFVDTARSTYHVTYDNFRIADEFGNYNLISLGQFGGTTEIQSRLNWCPANEIFSNCTCEMSCDNHDSCITTCSERETCICPRGFFLEDEECIPIEQCGCFLEGKGVLKNGESDVNHNCSRQCNCTNNQLTCSEYMCSSYATCDERNGIRGCYCNELFEGDGRNCEFPAKDCNELYMKGFITDGIYIIYAANRSTNVYCDMSSKDAGWTVIQRRTNGTENFSRDWNAYKEGFGDLNGEHWLGNDVIHSMTHQKNYQLRIEMITSDDTTVYVLYNQFSISNETYLYALTDLGTYSGDADSYIEWCETNKIFSTCACEYTCDNPESCTRACTDSETCICPSGTFISGSDCISEEQCDCYVAEYGIIPNGVSYISANCATRYNCSYNGLEQEVYACSSGARCEETDGNHRCVCNDGLLGDGLICQPPPKDCYDLYNAGTTVDGVYTIYPTGSSSSGFQVYCRMSTDGGGWTVFQRRQDGTVVFYQNWDGYKHGFGNLQSEHWLGNDQLYLLTNQKNYEMRIDLSTSTDGLSYYALFDSFRISNENNYYTIVELGSYSGNSGFQNIYVNHRFSTYDRDNDRNSLYNCAEKHRSGWWFPTYYSEGSYHWYTDGHVYYCTWANLNGEYWGGSQGGSQSIFWWRLPSGAYNVRQSEMRIRPV